MKPKLRRLRRRGYRLFLTLWVNTCYFVLNRFTSTRAQTHWVGRHGRRRRPERALFTIAFFWTLLAAGPQRHMVWLTAWGGMLSIFLTLLAAYRLFPRKRYHWVK